jgi:hypothetical protein
MLYAFREAEDVELGPTPRNKLDRLRQEVAIMKGEACFVPDGQVPIAAVMPAAAGREAIGV